MIIRDAQLPPALAVRITEIFEIPCFLRNSSISVMLRMKRFPLFPKQKTLLSSTRNDDFVSLLNRFGSPPKVIWLACGNTSKNRLKEIFEANLTPVLALLETNDLVEITGLWRFPI